MFSKFSRQLMFFLVITAPCLLLACSADGKTTSIKNLGDLANYVGKEVVVEGNVSNIPWQHLTGRFAQHMYYFDVGPLQTIVYTNEEITCKGALEVTGKVVELKGGGKGTKIDETHVEYQIVADKLKCL